MTFGLITFAIALIAIQPPIMRKWPWLDAYGFPRRAKPFAYADILEQKTPSESTGPPADHPYWQALADYTKWSHEADAVVARAGEVVNKYAPSTEIYIDGQTGKRIVPPGLDQYTRDQQLREMELQIAQHDRQMNMAWGQLQGRAETDFLAMLGAKQAQSEKWELALKMSNELPVRTITSIPRNKWSD